MSSVDRGCRDGAAFGAVSVPRSRRRYRYREIAVTDASYTAVNRRLTEGRARLRRSAHECDSQPPT
jgi:hypothetical protein